MLHHRRSHRRGAALVEAALILPVFIILIGIAVDYSRIIYSTVTLSGSARNGALYEFDPVNATESNYSTYTVAGDADGTNISGNLTMSESIATANGNTDVTVTADSKFHTISTWLILPKQQGVTRSIVVRKAQLIPDPPP
jgi:Flp pilus assembly protein TadG